MIVPLNNYKVCPVCKGNVVLMQALKILDEKKHGLVESWCQNPSTVVYNIDSTNMWRRMLLDKYGDTTLMPTYLGYRNTWKGSLLLSPFEYNWETFDACMAWDRNYLRIVNETFKKQIEMWGAPLLNNAEKLQVFEAFENFADIVDFVAGVIDEMYPEEPVDYKI